jgi:hypothetical protein
MTLKDATISVVDKQGKIDWHRKRILHIEELLKIPSLPGWRRSELQISLLSQHRALQVLLNGIPTNDKGKMKSFVGTDKYEYNG